MPIPPGRTWWQHGSMVIVEVKWEITADYEPGVIAFTNFQTERNIQITCNAIM